MPRATVVLTPVRRPLETVPADELDEEAGWVEIRRLSFGEKLQKDQEAMKMRFDVSTAENATSNIDAEIAMINELATLREFAKCVLDHNLTDDKGRKLSFTSADDVRSLDPRVGQEITELLAELNDFEKKTKQTQGVDEKGKSSQA